MATKKLATFLLFLLVAVGCKERVVREINVKYVLVNQQGIRDSLNNYFNKYELEPDLIINNVSESQKKVVFANHTVSWFNAKEEIKVKIDNDLFSLGPEIALNEVAEGDLRGVDSANNWDQIQYFAPSEYNEEEIAIIRMNFSPCTGIGCSVDYFLVYDFRHRTRSFFGTFRSNREINLYKINNKNNWQISYVSKSYVEQPAENQQVSIVYELFSLTKNGNFLLQKDKKGTPYYIKHTFPIEDSSHVRETLEAHWFEEIK